MLLERFPKFYDSQLTVVLINFLFDLDVKLLNFFHNSLSKSTGLKIDIRSLHSRLRICQFLYKSSDISRSIILS